MNIYLAASCDTTTKQAAYSFKIEKIYSESVKHFDSTTPRELLIGLKNAFNYIVQNRLDEKFIEFTLFTNNEYLINSINNDKIIYWKSKNWIKDSGDEVANKDVLQALYNFLMYFRERDRKIFATQPVTPEEINILNSVSKAALAKRKG